MDGKILRSFGGYVLKYRSEDIEELRTLAWWIKEWYNIDFKDVVY